MTQRLRGKIDSQHSSSHGGWLRSRDRIPFYFKWSDAPDVRRGVDADVEFTLTTLDGRPVAVDVQPIHN